MATYKDYGIGAIFKKNENWFEWILSDFSTLFPSKKTVMSPCCYFDECAFRLSLGLKSAEYNGVSKTEYWIELGFSFNSSTPLVYYQVRMGLLGKNDEEKEVLTGKTDSLKSFWYCNKMDTSDFQRIIDDNKGHLRIFCAILHEDEDINATKFTSLGLKTGLTYKKDRATTCGFAGCASHKPSSGVLFQGIERLLEDFKLLLSSEDESDVTLKVRGRCFKVHKNILMFRSPVFYSMFKQESKEESKEVAIDDCDPETFPEFLSYLYTGRISNLTSDKTHSLAYTAEKFGLVDLKKECIECFENYRKERNVLKGRKK